VIRDNLGDLKKKEDGDGGWGSYVGLLTKKQTTNKMGE
jgi:hypothetical protein